MTIPLVVLLGFLAFGLVKWGKHKVSGIVVGVLFGLTLASTAIGPGILSGFQAFGTALFGAFGQAVN